MENFITKFLLLPPAVTEHGPQVDSLLLYVHALMFALFLGWGAFFLFVLYRFRQKRNPKADPVGIRGHMSSYLEGVVAILEAILLIAFAVPIWARSASPKNFPAANESTVVRVIGRQFNWIARYPGADGTFGMGDAKFVTAQNPLGVDPSDPKGKDDIVTETSEVVVPVGKPVIAYISSLDVIHSFSVKSMRVTQDAIPGISLPVWFKPTKEGVYQINCAQLCGNGHANMRGTVKVVSEKEFKEFMASKAKTAGAPVSYE